jgi:hypothetical protein
MATGLNITFDITFEVNSDIICLLIKNGYATPLWCLKASYATAFWRR